MLDGTIGDGDQVTVDADGDELTFAIVASAED